MKYAVTLAQKVVAEQVTLERSGLDRGHHGAQSQGLADGSARPHHAGDAFDERMGLGGGRKAEHQRGPATGPRQSGQRPAS